MKRILIIFSLFVALFAQYSCTKTAVEAGFKDVLKYTIYDYIVANPKDYSSFLLILKSGGMDKTLSAYNPNGQDYTLFLPDNAAVDNFIKQTGSYASLDDLVKDAAYCKALGNYHVVNMGTATQDFPFGAFTQPSLSGDYLNVNFILAKDTTYYKINNQAPVIKTNIKVSNGYVHVISEMLRPITLNSYGWLKKNPDFKIFTAAIEATGINTILDVDMKLKDQPLQPFTMLVEPDSIFKKRGITNLDDLKKEISPARTDYTSSTNPLNLFVGYHILTVSRFLNDLVGQSTNYNTFADVPLAINGMGLDIMINKSKETFVSSAHDTTDWVGLYYDQSNVVTQSGAIHFIDQIMKPQVPSQLSVSFAFWEEATLNEYRKVPGTYFIENPKLLKSITWSGAKLFFVKSTDPAEYSWNQDYLQIDGDFTISYQLPKIIQGKYDVVLGANHYGVQNALVEVYVDGNKIGGLIDLTKGASANNPYWPPIAVGSVEFKNYAAHIVTVKSLIPGRFIWDYVQFNKPTN